MKKLIIPLLGLILFYSVSCNNEKKDAPPESSPKTAADSLMHEVMDGHNIAMAKMGRLSTAEKEVQRIIDSIAKLPAKTKNALASYKIQLDTALKNLHSAKEGMEKWMDEFNMDSSITNTEERIKYLANEKLKVNVVKENILHGLQKTDSLLKKSLTQ